MKKILGKLLPYLGLILLVIFFWISTQGRFLAVTNLSNVLDQCLTVIIMSVGTAFIFACGRMDMSCGGIMALSQLFLGRLMLNGTAVPILLLVSVVTSVLIYLLAGAVSTYLKVMPFIVSMCVSNICMGIVSTALSKDDLLIPYRTYALLDSLPVKLTVVVLLILVGVIVFNKTSIGRELKAIGGNELASRQSGVKVEKLVLLSFVVSGLFVAVGSLLNLAHSTMVTPTSGSTLGLNCITALVLGGFPLAGGTKSRIMSAVVGALTVTVLNNGLSLMGVDPAVSLTLKGILFLVIVGASYERAKGAEIQ